MLIQLFYQSLLLSHRCRRLLPSLPISSWFLRLRESRSSQKRFFLACANFCRLSSSSSDMMAELVLDLKMIVVDSICCLIRKSSGVERERKENLTGLFIQPGFRVTSVCCKVSVIKIRYLQIRLNHDLKFS